jgi:hypothetical protein
MICLAVLNDMFAMGKHYVYDRWIALQMVNKIVIDKLFWIDSINFQKLFVSLHHYLKNE